MTEWIDPRSIGPKIRMMMPSLTPLEARVVDSVFGRKDFSDTTALKEIADDAGVSEAMVVKIAKKLGFSGYRDFRQNVASYSRLQVAEMQEDLSPEDTGREIVNKVFRASMQALEETLAIADVEAFERAAGYHPRARGSATSTAWAARRRSPGTCRTSSFASACAPRCSTTPT